MGQEAVDNAAHEVQSSSGKSLRQYLEDVPRHGSTTDAVTEALREAILDGSLAPSTWLREDDLAQQLRVSRTPVREALRRLSDEQLTVRSAHRGSMVAPMSLDDILAVYAVREALEGAGGPDDGRAAASRSRQDAARRACEDDGRS